MNRPTEPGPVETSIRQKVRLIVSLPLLIGSMNVVVQLTDLLEPNELQITNDSWQHRHHAAMRETGGGDGETRTS